MGADTHAGAAVTASGVLPGAAALVQGWTLSVTSTAGTATRLGDGVAAHVVAPETPLAQANVHVPPRVGVVGDRVRVGLAPPRITFPTLGARGTAGGLAA